MGVRFKSKGRAELINKIRQIAPKAIDKMADAQMAVAQEAVSAMKERAPNRSGDYADSIHAAKQSDNPGKVPFGSRKTTDPNAVGIYASFIWRFLEFGTKSSGGGSERPDRRYKSGKVMSKAKRPHAATPAQPHIFPVWRGMRKKGLRRIRAAVNKGVREAMKK
ncbi:HK97 gp10 family phage protein [Brucella sp. TWI559]